MTDEETKAQTTMRHYMALLNEVNSLGMVGFAQLVDTLPDGELDELLSAANLVRTKVAAFRERGA
jgi:hypothetical protein